MLQGQVLSGQARARQEIRIATRLRSEDHADDGRIRRPLNAGIQYSEQIEARKYRSLTQRF